MERAEAEEVYDAGREACVELLLELYPDAGGRPARYRPVRGGVRFIGLDTHRDFCEVAIASSVAALELFAGSLAKDDAVALEATSGAARSPG